MIEPAVPTLDFVAHFRVTLATPQEVGDTPAGRRRFIAITGGCFTGPALTGTVLPGGGDWQLVRPDGTAVIDTRYTLRTDDGALLYVTTHGYRHGRPEVLERLAAGRHVDPSEYYFRVTVGLETASDTYYDLNHTLIVASAIREPDAVAYDAYAVR